MAFSVIAENILLLLSVVVLEIVITINRIFLLHILRTRKEKTSGIDIFHPIRLIFLTITWGAREGFIMTYSSNFYFFGVL